MGRIEGFGQTRNVEITVLVDNRADLLVKSTKTVKRFTKEPLLAEHGFAALVDLKDCGVRILWDAGLSRTVLLENADRMGVDLQGVDKIALSHGHMDHCAAISDVIRMIVMPLGPREWSRDVTLDEIRVWMAARRVPLITHPAAFRERWWIGKDGKKHGPRLVPHQEWEAVGAQIILSEDPYELGPGCWTTGAIPRRSFEKAGTPPSLTYREGDAFIRDCLEDDQSLILNVKDKGLVVLTGCAHSGIVNTVEYAREISGVKQVWAILGGFHLAPAKVQEVQLTIDRMKGFEPEMVVPSHCTGFQATSQFSSQMPDQFVLSVVGTTYLF